MSSSLSSASKAVSAAISSAASSASSIAPSASDAASSSLSQAGSSGSSVMSSASGAAAASASSAASIGSSALSSASKAAAASASLAGSSGSSAMSAATASASAAAADAYSKTSTSGISLMGVIAFSITAFAILLGVLSYTGQADLWYDYALKMFFKAEAKAEEKALLAGAEGQAADLIKDRLKKNPLMGEKELEQVQSGLGREAAMEGLGGVNKKLTSLSAQTLMGN